MSEMDEAGQEHKALIMVVDDNPEFLSGIKLTLEMEGYKVWTALNGQEAMNVLKVALLNFLQGERDEKPHDGERAHLPDLILADIMMPVMDGYELYEQTQINPYLNFIPFIFLTAKSSTEDIRYGKELGSDEYLSKLTSSEDILSIIKGKLKRFKKQQYYAGIKVRQTMPIAVSSVNKGDRRLLVALIPAAIFSFILGVFVAVVWMGGLS